MSRRPAVVKNVFLFIMLKLIRPVFQTTGRVVVLFHPRVETRGYSNFTPSELCFLVNKPLKTDFDYAQSDCHPERSRRVIPCVFLFSYSLLKSQFSLLRFENPNHFFIEIEGVNVAGGVSSNVGCFAFFCEFYRSGYHAIKFA